MRHETRNIYQFNELSEAAKQKAIENYRTTAYQYGYNWQDENIDSLKTFCDRLDITLKNYYIGLWGNSYIYYSYDGLENIDTDDLKGLRLRTWLINNFLPELKQGKFYTTAGYYDKNKKYHYTFRHSNINFEYDNCSLTGYCMDNELIDPILEFIKHPRAETSLTDILDNCFDSFIAAVIADMEDQESDDYISEAIEINDYEFLENGDQL